MKYTITAVIPVVQYGNLQPSIEVEAETFEEAHAQAMPHIQKVWGEYGEKPLVSKVGNDGFVELTSFTGERVLWNERDHICKTLDGVVLMGGSTYAKRFEKPFDAALMAEKCAKAWGVSKEAVLDIWKMNAQTSSMLGNALHSGLEAAHRHWKDGETIKSIKKDLTTNYALPKQPIIRKAVLSYVEQFGINGIPEVLVTDVKNGMCGWIDSLHILADNKAGKKIVSLEDYKSSVMDEDKFVTYNHQQSWYGQILINHGYTVQDLYLTAYDGEKWVRRTQKMLEVKL